MNFFRDVVSHLLKNAFEGHTKFSVADNTAVGDNPIRSISLDAVPVNNETMISLAWEGGEKLFEKTLSEQEAGHQFELISSDLAEVASLTKQGQYDAAKDLMKKLGEKYAENTGELVQTNLPPLHNTQASSEDDHLLKQAKITMQNLWFSNNDELLEYQQKQKGAAKPGDQDHIPLWDKNKGAKAPGDSLAPASMSYEDLEDKKEKEHEDMQNHIDEKIKTELESALQEKAASVFGPDQVELVQVLRKNGRNWDEIKKILVKDFGFDKESTNIFVDEQRQGSDPTGIEVEPVKEDDKEKSPLTPPEDLVSPETHDKLLHDHEDKKKDNSPVEAPPEQNFTPKDVMDIPEDDIQDESSLSNEIARADNGEIHKVAAPSNLNPLQEPIQQEPTTPQQDVVPMGKKPLDHEAPQKGDRVFVASDMSDEKAGFEGTFVSSYQSAGRDQYVVETDQGDLLDVEAHRVSKISDNGGAQTAEPSMEPQIAGMQPDNDIPVTPKMSDFHADQAMALKKEAELLLAFAKEADEQTTFWDERSYDEKHPMMAKYPEIVDKIVAAIEKYGDNWYKVEQTMFYDSPFYMMNLSSTVGSREGGQLIKEVYDWMKQNQSGEDKVFTPRQYEDIEAELETEFLKKEGAGETMATRCVCNHFYKDHCDDDTCSFESCDCKKFNRSKRASLNKKAGTTWTDIKMPEPPEPGWRVQHQSGMTGTVVDGSSDKFANVTLDQPIKEDEATCRSLGLSWVQLERGDHPKGVYAIYAEGFGSWNGAPNWLMTDAGGQPILPEDYKLPDHDRNPNPEPAIDTESAMVNWTCPKCGNKASASSVYDEKICMKNGCGTSMQKQASLNKKASTDYYFAKPVPLGKLKKIPGVKIGKGSEGGIVATDGSNYVHLNVNDAGLIDGFTRFGGNDPSEIYDAFSSVVGDIKDEHEMQDIWYAEAEAEHVKPGHQCTEDCDLYEYPDEQVQAPAPVVNTPKAPAVKKKKGSDFEKGISQNKDASGRKKCEICSESFTPTTEGQVYCSKDCSDDDKIMTDEASLKTAAEPVDPSKTKYKEYKITPKYAPKEEAVPATPEIDAVLSKMDALQQNLATLESARQQIQAKMQEEMGKIDQQGERVQMEAALQESIEKAGILINAVGSKVVQWKDKLYTLQTEEVQYVPKLTQKEMLTKIYEKFAGAEKYVKDVLNGMLSQAKSVTENTLIQWPNKKSSMNKEATILDDLNRFNEELMAALQALSSPI